MKSRAKLNIRLNKSATYCSQSDEENNHVQEILLENFLQKCCFKLTDFKMNIIIVFDVK